MANIMTPQVVESCLGQNPGPLKPRALRIGPRVPRPVPRPDIPLVPAGTQARCASFAGECRSILSVYWQPAACCRAGPRH